MNEQPPKQQRVRKNKAGQVVPDNWKQLLYSKERVVAWLKGEITRDVIAHYLLPLKSQGIDTLILGCTHYPLLKEAMREVLGDGIRLVDSACETVRTIREFLKTRDLMRSGSTGHYQFYVSDDPLKFRDHGRMFLAREIPVVEHVAW